MKGIFIDSITTHTINYYGCCCYCCYSFWRKSYYTVQVGLEFAIKPKLTSNWDPFVLTPRTSTGIYRYTSLYSTCLHFTFCSNSCCTEKLVKLVSRAFLQELPIPYCGMFFITKKATSIYPC